MKAKYSATLLLAGIAMFVTSMAVLASTLDQRIDSSAKNSYVFKTYLKNDEIRVDSKNGVVTLTGTVGEESHKSLAEDTARFRQSRAANAAP